MDIFPCGIPHGIKVQYRLASLLIILRVLGPIIGSLYFLAAAINCLSEFISLLPCPVSAGIADDPFHSGTAAALHGLHSRIDSDRSPPYRPAPEAHPNFYKPCTRAPAHGGVQRINFFRQIPVQNAFQNIVTYPLRESVTPMTATRSG